MYTPGFSAEASLSRTAGVYFGGASAVSFNANAASVTPAASNFICKVVGRVICFRLGHPPGCEDAVDALCDKVSP